jgi:hypothetical protein
VWTNGCSSSGDCSLQSIETTPQLDWTTAAVNQIDRCVSVADARAGSLGSVCADAPQTFAFSSTVGPFASCGDYVVSPAASYTGATSGANGSAAAPVVVHLPCGTGCTLTAGYWNGHAGASAANDMVTRLLPIMLGISGGAKSFSVTSAAQAIQLLAGSASTNLITKLYAQLLAAKLNVADGADASQISTVITAADGAVAKYDPTSKLNPAATTAVTALATTLEAYNTGAVTQAGPIGPGACST